MDVIAETQVTTKYAASSARTVGLKNRAGVSKLERLNIVQTTECSTESVLTASCVTTTELSSEISASSAYGK